MLSFQFHHRRSRYWIALIVRVLLSIFVGYRYIYSLSSTQPGKGGTFVEATLQQPNYLPYITPQDADKFYQSLLFEGCLYPIFSGTQVEFQEDLCEVTTSDFQTFVITIKTGAVWQDGTDVSLNDLYFTYKSIIKDNYRNLPHLGGYSNLQISADTESVKVIFPKASRDNMVFFTNFILPAHLLANKSLEEYVMTFLQQPIGSTCVLLQKSPNDPDSYIFDLSSCDNFALKNYQIKRFSGQQSLETYVRDHKQIIDFSLNPLPEDIYEPTSVLLNTYLISFFNTQALQRSTDQRKGLAALLQNIFSQESASTAPALFVPESYLFDVPDLSLPEIKTLLAPENPHPVAEESPPPIRELPEQLDWSTGTGMSFVRSETIDDKYTLTMTYPDSFSRVSITYGSNEYFPTSYSPAAKTNQYNLSPEYRTITSGENTYTIQAYQGNQVVATYTLTIWYLQSPPVTPEPEPEPDIVTPEEDPFVVVYYQEPTTTALVNKRKAFLDEHDRTGWFVFQGFSDPHSLEGKLTSQDYDIAIRAVNIGLNKDMSTLFSTTDPIINPSMQRNDALSNLITQYFLTDDESQKANLLEDIQAAYRQNPQLYIFGKQMGTVRIRRQG